jgi:predicted transcriptional regulator
MVYDVLKRLANEGTPLGTSFIRYSSNWKYSNMMLYDLVTAGIISQNITDYNGYFQNTYSLTQKGFELISKIERLNDICPLREL